jgi:hypothetical protein
MKQKITLEAWAVARYNPPPSIRTLRLWARELRIYPTPQKVGRTYYVDPDARYTGSHYGSSAA